MKSIEIILTNLINGLFETTANVEDCIQAYATLYYYSKRDTLKPLFDKKVKRVSAKSRGLKNDSRLLLSDVQDVQSGNQRYENRNVGAGRML